MLQRKKLQNSISDEHGCENPQQNTSESNPAICKKIIHHDTIQSYPRNARLDQHLKVDQRNVCVSGLKK